jgi:uncharacterized protein (DUF1697 family)
MGPVGPAARRRFGLRYVALLRGINVGPSKRIPMAELKRLFEERRFTSVRTFLQSGNVVFASDQEEASLQPLLEHAIAERFGFPVPVLLRTEEEFRRALDDCPFTPEEIAAAEIAAEGDSQYIAFLRTPPTPDDLVRLAAAAQGTGDRFQVVSREIHLLFEHTVRTSKLAAQLDRLSSPATTRNGSSAARIAALFDEARRIPGISAPP